VTSPVIGKTAIDSSQPVPASQQLQAWHAQDTPWRETYPLRNAAFDEARLERLGDDTTRV
jgi:hypothetical protein